MVKVSKHGTIKYEDWLKERLRDPEEAAEYLNGSLMDEDPGVFALAVRDVASVYGGMGAVARNTGLNRESLYKMLSEQGNPQFDSVRLIMKHLGFDITFTASSNLKTRAKKQRPAAKRRSAA